MKFIDLCSGIGGFHLAVKQVLPKSKCILASEIDKNCLKIYKQVFNIDANIDITKLDETKIPEYDFLFAGFPCQSFSIAGKKEGFLDKTKGTIFFDILRIIKKTKPSYILLENVKNIRSHDNGNTIKIIKSSLEDLEYSVDIQLLNAVNFGLPQKRERVFILATKNNLKLPLKSIQNSLLIQDILEPNISDDYYFINRKCEYTESIKKDYLNPIRIGQYGAGRQGERIYSQNGVGITLSAQGGGLAGKTGAYLIEDKIRKLTPREIARLQGFPDNFPLSLSIPQHYKQFGNAVPVNVVVAILESIFNA